MFFFFFFLESNQIVGYTWRASGEESEGFALARDKESWESCKNEGSSERETKLNEPSQQAPGPATPIPRGDRTIWGKPGSKRHDG